MRQDAVVVAALVVAFAILVTAHVSLGVGLARRAPRWQCALALVALPLAPWWGWRQRMRIRSVVWVVAAVVYAVTFALTLR
jgi:hypothetical protein